MSTMDEKGLGRLPSKDERDQNYLLAAPRVTAGRTSRAWYDNGWWGDQGSRPYCVGYAWAHWIEDSPRTHPDPNRTAYVDPVTIYTNAQARDEWEGDQYDGTSVRGGAKYLRDIGLISEFLWAFDVDTLAKNILEVGPVVAGTEWTSEMFEPDAKGVIHFDGPVIGGHAYLVNGYNKAKKLFRIKNSWGRAWGKNGRAFIGYDDMALLLARDGEACMAVEVSG